MGTEGDDFKCTGGIKMAFLIPCKSNKPHPFEIPLATGALSPSPSALRSARVCLRMLIKLSAPRTRQNANAGAPGPGHTNATVSNSSRDGETLPSPSESHGPESLLI